MLTRAMAAVFISVLVMTGHAALVTARSAAQAVTPREPQTAAEWVADGDSWYEAHVYTRAARAYENAVRLNQKDTGTLLRLAVSYNQSGRFADALAAADAVIKSNPGVAEAHNERAYAQQSLGDDLPQGSPGEKQRYDAAIASYREAIRLKPTFGLAYQGLADTYFQVSANADAIQAYTQAVRFIPRDVRLRYDLGVLLSNARRDQEAAEQLAVAVRLDGDHYDARGALATVYRRLGRLPESLEQLRLALRIKPDYAAGHLRLALVYAVQGNRAAALDEYRIAEALDKSVVQGGAATFEKYGVIVQPQAGAAKPPQQSACPTVRTTGPDAVRGGEPATFTTAVRGSDPRDTPTFNWTVSAGTISSGQGTSSITVDTNDTGGSTTAFVAVGGLPEKCEQRSAARTTVLGRNLTY